MWIYTPPPPNVIQTCFLLCFLDVFRHYSKTQAPLACYFTILAHWSQYLLHTSLKIYSFFSLVITDISLARAKHHLHEYNRTGCGLSSPRWIGITQLFTVRIFRHRPLDDFGVIFRTSCPSLQVVQLSDF